MNMHAWRTPLARTDVAISASRRRCVLVLVVAMMGLSGIGPQDACAWRCGNSRANSWHEAGRSTAGCLELEVCDAADSRDEHLVTAPYVDVRVALHYVPSPQSTGAFADAVQAVEVGLDALNDGLQASAAAFRVILVTSTDHSASASQYYPLSSEPDEFQSQVNAMKSALAVQPTQYLNMFVIDAPGSIEWAGYATFPWDALALAASGGLWVDQQQAANSASLLAHEIAHCLGLWHVFEGYPIHAGQPWDCDDGCIESMAGADRDRNGDLCSDTGPTPGIGRYNEVTRAVDAADPAVDCAGDAWSMHALHNVMSYDTASQHPDAFFTPQQIARMRCYLANVLSSWTEPSALIVRGTVASDGGAGSSADGCVNGASFEAITVYAGGSRTLTRADGSFELTLQAPWLATLRLALGDALFATPFGHGGVEYYDARSPEDREVEVAICLDHEPIRFDQLEQHPDYPAPDDLVLLTGRAWDTRGTPDPSDDIVVQRGTVRWDLDGSVADIVDGAFTLGAALAPEPTSGEVAAVLIDAHSEAGTALGATVYPMSVAASNTGVVITVPSPGDRWAGGTRETVCWSYEGGVPRTNIEISVDGGATFSFLDSAAPGELCDSVMAPEIESESVYIRVTAENDPEESDTVGPLTTYRADVIPIAMRLQGYSRNSHEDRGVAFSPDGSAFFAEPQPAYGVMQHSATTLRSLPPSFPSRTGAVGVSPSGRWVAAVYGDRQELYVLDTVTRFLQSTPAVEALGAALEWIDEDRIAVQGMRGNSSSFGVVTRTGGVVFEEITAEEVLSLTVAGGVVYAACDNDGLLAWRSLSGGSGSTSIGCADNIFGVLALEDPQDLILLADGLSACNNASVLRVRRTNFAVQAQDQPFNTSSAEARSGALHPDGSLIAVGSNFGEIALLDPVSLGVRHRVESPDGANAGLSIDDLAWSSEGMLLAKAGDTIYVYIVQNTSPPSVEASPAVVSQDGFIIQGRVSDPSGISSVMATVNSADGSAVEMEADGTFSIQETGLGPGEYRVNIMATDLGGLSSRVERTVAIGIPEAIAFDAPLLSPVTVFLPGRPYILVWRTSGIGLPVRAVVVGPHGFRSDLGTVLSTAENDPEEPGMSASGAHSWTPGTAGLHTVRFENSETGQLLFAEPAQVLIADGLVESLPASAVYFAVDANHDGVGDSWTSDGDDCTLTPGRSVAEGERRPVVVWDLANVNPAAFKSAIAEFAVPADAMAVWSSVLEFVPLVEPSPGPSTFHAIPLAGWSCEIPDVPYDSEATQVLSLDVTDVIGSALNENATAIGLRLRLNGSHEGEGAAIAAGLSFCGQGELSAPEIRFSNDELPVAVAVSVFDVHVSEDPMYVDVNVALSESRPVRLVRCSAGGCVELASDDSGRLAVRDLRTWVASEYRAVDGVTGGVLASRPGVGAPQASRTLMDVAVVPNPFNPATRVMFGLVRPETVQVDIFGLDGRLVRRLFRGPMSAGHNEIQWDGRDGAGGTVASGAYFVRVQVSNEQIVKKVVLLK